MESVLISNDPRLSLSPFATADIKETWAYLSDFGDKVAEDFIRSIVRICGLISQNPAMGTDRSEIIVGLRLHPYKQLQHFLFFNQQSCPMQNDTERMG
ncbi:MAG: type II toxin-antitoxin system RelE/ParE family toxin [Pyrinomonadaceae bacterium]